ncbi:hypothetical protein PV326_000937 [Microctonus aethiopoides]|nr:hypothetical protein PV326_000937 [Microctonus aethiopoides]
MSRPDSQRLAAAHKCPGVIGCSCETMATKFPRVPAALLYTAFAEAASSLSLEAHQKQEEEEEEEEEEDDDPEGSSTADDDDDDDDDDCSVVMMSGASKIDG